MLRTASQVLAVAALSSFTLAGVAHAGGKDKPDPFVQQAIEQTAAQPIITPEPEPVIEEIVATDEAIIAEPMVVPEEEPKLGRKFGNLRFLPSLILQQDYNSNITAADGNTGRREADMITHLVPRLNITLDESRHDINFNAEYETRRYWANNGENHDNYKAGIEGHLTASPSFRVPFGLVFNRPHEERTDDLTAQQWVKPLEQRDLKAALGFEYQPSSYGIALLGRYRTLEYEDGVDATGAPVIRRDADHDETEAEARFTFDFNPRNKLILAGLMGDHDYEIENFQAGGFVGPVRNSNKSSVFADWKLRFKNMATDLKLGFENRNYDDNAIGGVRALIGGAKFVYDYSDKTALTFAATRDVHEDEEVIEPIIRTTAGLSVDHQLRETILLGAGIDYGTWTFQDSARDDDYWTYRMLADWMISERVSFGAEYNRMTRDSEAAGADFSRDIILLSLRGRL